MRETVVIPSCHRPELLALCLLALSGAPDCPEVHIYADTAAKIDEIEYVRDQYFPTATIFHAKPHISAQQDDPLAGGVEESFYESGLMRQ